MAISHSEIAALTCPSCGARFDAAVWTLVDAAERPDLMDALRAGTLNAVPCPRCGRTSQAGTPLLLHDPVRRRVYFAAPSGAAEHEVREQVHALLYTLVEGLPAEARLPYLGDVQVEQELEGVRRAVLRRERRPGGGGHRPEGGGRGIEAAATPPQRSTLDVQPSPLLDAVQSLLAADSAEEIEAVIAQHPQLRDPAADAAIAGLADIAFAQGERDVAHALAEARQILRDLRLGTADLEPRDVRRAAASSAPGAQSSILSPQSSLSDAAYQALMRAATPADLADVVRDHPALLEPWADDALGLRAEAALDEGNERLAQAVEARRDALAELRAALTDEHELGCAIQELLRAGDREEALARALSDHPVLLTDAAQESLFRIAAEARARGDDTLAKRVVERRAMLRTVRDGLEESS
ncbi:MAG TPA: CpXC domain-containing protein [Roseiflexaceae bacterium]|nr:CpXC domain-containing protein [Roseiflexaceae bacterium]